MFWLSEIENLLPAASTKDTCPVYVICEGMSVSKRSNMKGMLRQCIWKETVRKPSIEMRSRTDCTDLPKESKFVVILDWTGEMNIHFIGYDLWWLQVKKLVDFNNVESTNFQERFISTWFNVLFDFSNIEDVAQNRW